MPRVSKAKAAATKKRRAKDANEVGALLRGAFGGRDLAEHVRQTALAEAERLASKDASLTPEQRSMMLVRMGGLAEKLAKLTGEGRQMDERAILRSVAGKRLIQIVTEALRPWPKACIALAEALESVE